MNNRVIHRYFDFIADPIEFDLWKSRLQENEFVKKKCIIDWLHLDDRKSEC